MNPRIIFEEPALPGLPRVQRPDLQGLNLGLLTAWQHRVALASKGWMTDFEVKKGLGYRGWSFDLHAKHHHWHGSLSSVHLGMWAPWDEGVTPWDDVAATCELVRTQMLKLHERCDETWSACTEYVPYGYRRNGAWEKDTIASKYYRKFPSGVVQPERTQVTECLPGWPGQIGFADFIRMDGAEGDDWVRAVVDMVRMGSENGACLHWNDSLNPFGEIRPGHRNRRWRFEHRGRFLMVGGRRVIDSDSPRLLDCTTQNITADGAKGLAVMATGLARRVIKLSCIPETNTIHEMKADPISEDRPSPPRI